MRSCRGGAPLKPHVTPLSLGRLGTIIMVDADTGPDLFVSHSSADAHVATEIATRLEMTGIKCWIAPRDVEPGIAYADALYYAIEKAPVFVVLMSAAANGSTHVARELAIADQMNKPVVPVLVEQFRATGAFCYYTRAAHFYRWVEKPDEVIQLISRTVATAKASPRDQRTS